VSTKVYHEIRDPLHVFVRLDTDERRVLNSRPVQRLRHVQQLALSNLVYPGATHRRFEHSLGVMELAGRVFDTITNKHLPESISSLLPQLKQESQLQYWRRAVRMAALCHDVGHLPFSHAAEEELLPEGWSHERLSRALIESAEMRSVFETMTPPVRCEDVVKCRFSVGRHRRFSKPLHPELFTRG
jgi:HD superfamily phosphohydrolase